jgi:2-polyprenyl-3-methyl-5-hydroxy-6-metoxy-1,4-benzoquinol methylase
MTITSHLSEQDEQQREAFAERIFGSVLGAIDLYSIHIGDRLGLYRALAEAGPLTPAALAAAAGIDPRYAREWLEQQAVGGIVEVDDPGAAAADRRFALPAGHAEALADRDSLAFSPPFARIAVAVAGPIPAIVDAFRTGGGVPWQAYGADAREAQADLNRVQFAHFLGSEWLPSVPDVDERLRAPGARVADLACGEGWSSISIAQAYPEARVDGYDVDEASIDAARAHAAAEGVAHRVRFHLRDVAAADEPVAGGYDLVCIFEALHDMAHPVEALAAARSLAAPDGTVLVMDERTNEGLTPGDPLEQFFYGVSILVCLPTGMSEEHSAATGTVMRPATLRGYAEAAGFSGVEVLGIEHPFFRFYRLG